MLSARDRWVAVEGTMKRGSLAVSLFLLLAPLLAHAGGAKLQGTWLLTHDPDGPVVEDWMRFAPGSVELGNDEGVYITCPYEVTRYSVLLRCQVRGQEKKLRMLVKSEFRELVNPSGAVYTRQ